MLTAILADFTGLTPEPVQYQKFKDLFIQGIYEDSWSIDDATVESFVKEYGPKPGGDHAS